MSYFDLESDNFQHYVDAIGQKYHVSTHVNQEEWFNRTQEKIASLLRKLLKDSEIDLSPHIHLDPLPDGTNSAKTIKRYILVQYLPKNYTKSLPKKNKYHGSAFIGLCIYIHPNDDVTFGIGVDDPSKNKAEREILKSYKDWAIGKLSIQDSKLLLLPTDFDAIISEIKPVLEEYIKKFRQKFMNENNATDSLPKVEPTKSVAIPRQFPLNQILFGPPGTGKTYNTINKALAIIENVKEDALIDKDDRDKLKKRFDAYLEDGQIMFTTFHQNMSYEDFIEGIKPIPPKGSEQVTYKVKKGIFRKICKKAIKNDENSDVEDTIFNETLPIKSKLSADNFDNAYEKFAQDVSKKGTIELKTLAGGKTFDIQITPKGVKARPHDGTGSYPIAEKLIRDWGLDLPEKYSDSYAPAIALHIEKKYLLNTDNSVKSIKNPKNYVLIIDEINRGNVSKIFGELITLIEDDKRLGEDEALKITLPYSKESFGVPNNLYIIGTMNTADRSVEALDTALRRRFNFVEMPPNYDLSQLNTAKNDYDLVNILKTINKRIEKLLGRDHLIGHSYFLSVKNEGDLKVAFQNKIIPLLQEYFFGDYGKIGLVLGSGFVEKETSTEDVFTNFEYEGGSADFAERAIYRIKNVLEMKDDELKKAIDKLLLKTK